MKTPKASKPKEKVVNTDQSILLITNLYEFTNLCFYAQPENLIKIQKLFLSEG